MKIGIKILFLYITHNIEFAFDLYSINKFLIDNKSKENSLEHIKHE